MSRCEYFDALASARIAKCDETIVNKIGMHAFDC